MNFLDIIRTRVLIGNRFFKGIGAILYPDIFNFVKKYPRNINELEALYIYSLAKKSNDIILDIGSNAGLSSIVSAFSNKTVISFEWFKGLQDLSVFDKGFYTGEYKTNIEDFKNNIRNAGVEKNILLIEGDCLETIPKLIEDKMLKSFSFAFIDLDLYHLYIKTIENLLKITKGGEKILIHDYSAVGVKIAVKNLLDKFPQLKIEKNYPIFTLCIKK